MTDVLKKTALPLLGLGALALGQPAFAEDTNLGGRTPTKEEVIRALQPAPETAPVLTRGIHLHPVDPSGANGTAAPGTAAPKAISLEIRFDFDSAQLTADAIRQLTPVAEALASGELRSVKFLVEGHTDAQGSDEYNQDLSLRRAASVRSFFVEKHGLDTARIQSVGRGETMLLDPANPDSAANRRVRVVALR